MNEEQRENEDDNLKQEAQPPDAQALRDLPLQKLAEADQAEAIKGGKLYRFLGDAN